MEVSSAMDMFVKEMGAEMSIYLTDHAPPDSDTLRRQRLMVQVVANDLTDQAPVPYEWATDRKVHIPATVCFLWDRPTPRSAAHRTMLRSLVQGAGVAPEDCAHVWTFPYALTHPPLPAQIALFKSATLQAIEASGARYVVLLGAAATKVWRADVQFTTLAKKAGVWKRRWWVFPMMNPIQVIVDRELQPEYKQTVYRMVNMVLADEGMDELGILCAEKGCTTDDSTVSAVYVYDPDGVPWCRWHYRRGHKQREAVQGKQAKKANLANEAPMFATDEYTVEE